MAMRGILLRTSSRGLGRGLRFASDKPIIGVCGGGNAAHVMVGDVGSRGYPIHLHAPFTPPGGISEAEVWERDLPADGMQINYAAGARKGQVKKNKPAKVSKHAKDVIPGCKYIFIPLPVFAHAPTLTEIVPYCDDDACIVAMPATGCFDWTADQVFKKVGKRVDIVGMAPLPYVCRMVTYGKEVNFMGVKDVVGCAAQPGPAINKHAPMIEEIIGLTVKRYPSFVPITLTPTNPIMHNGRLMGMFGPEWKSKGLNRMIKFYDETDEVSNYWLHKLDDENMAIARAVKEAIPGAVGALGGCSTDGTAGDIMNINNYLKWTYGPDITKWDTCKDAYQSNVQFHGVGSPMKEVSPGKWEPDFTNRYFQEDMPYGLMANKGMGELFGVPTPGMDAVIEWIQKEMGKKYLVNGKVNPNEHSMSPQAFGYSKEDIIKMYSA